MLSGRNPPGPGKINLWRYNTMRKIIAMLLCLMMAISCIPAMAEEAEAVKTGLSFVTDVASS